MSASCCKSSWLMVILLAHIEVVLDPQSHVEGFSDEELLDLGVVGENFVEGVAA